jgi:ribose transport system ATP-binding protein
VTALLELRGVTRRFPGVIALDAVDVDLQPGEVHVIAGENGAGKSTLLRIVAGADAPDEGELRLEGVPARFRGARDALGRGIAAVYQEGTLAPHLTVAENVALGREPVRRLGIVDRNRMRDEAARALSELGAGTIDVDAPVGTLGVASQRIVEVARAIARGGRVILLDEPTAALSEREVPALHDLVRRLAARGVGVVFVSHRLEEFAEIATRVTVLRNGRKVWTRPIADADVVAIVAAMAGEGAREAARAERAAPGDPILELVDLSAGPLAGVTLSVGMGEVVGVAGLVGSGRTALLRAIFGEIAIRSGVVRLGGTAVHFASPADAVRAGVGLVPEDRKGEGLALGLSITVNATLASLERFAGRIGIDRAREAAEVGRLVDQLAVRRRDLDQPVAELSGGNQQKVLLARWLARDARLLLLDEPAAGVDVGARAELYGQIAALAAAGKGVLLVASYLPELLAASHRIVVLHRGRVVADVATSECSPERVVSWMSTGTAS